MSNIEWTDATWNPLIGCRRVSEGCRNCYAETMAKRLVAMGAYPADVLREGGGWSGKVTLVPERLSEPLHWRKPRRVFVNSMSDLFHEDVPDEYIAAVFGVMAACPQHTFQVLTKRAERLPAWFAWAREQGGHLIEGVGEVSESDPSGAAGACVLMAGGLNRFGPRTFSAAVCQPWPLPNVWLGVSVENQAAADERIPMLLRTPAAVRFVSAEPLLGPVDLGLDMLEPPPDSGTHATWWWHRRDAMHPCDYSCGGPGEVLGPLDWVIVGGESGPGARACDVAWVRGIVEQCRDAGVACFVKQLGARPYDSAEPEWRDGFVVGTRNAVLPLRDRKGGDPHEWPEDLRVREWPRSTP